MGFAYAITLDADGQHKPEDIPLFLKANLEHPGALIIGARPLQGVERSKGSDFANQFSNFWFFVQTGKRIGRYPDRLSPLSSAQAPRLIPAHQQIRSRIGTLGFRLLARHGDCFHPYPGILSATQRTDKPFPTRHGFRSHQPPQHPIVCVGNYLWSALPSLPQDGNIS